MPVINVTKSFLSHYYRQPLLLITEFPKWLVMSLFILGLQSKITAQAPGDTIKTTSVNLALIQMMITNGIDSVRTARGLASLQFDSALFDAARDHAGYLVYQRSISHRQPAAHKATVQKRAELFGGNGFVCGENIAASFVGDLMADRSGRTYRNLTYRQLSDEFVGLWINSYDHKQNIINPLYSHTGLAVAFNTRSNRVVAVQVFGHKKRSNN